MIKSYEKCKCVIIDATSNKKDLLFIVIIFIIYCHKLYKNT